MPYRALLLDVDGTLLDSNGPHAHAWAEVLTAEGFPTDFATVRPLIGMGGDKIVPLLTGLDPESPRAKAIGERRAALFKEKYLPEVQPFPRVRQLIERIRGEQLRIVVATSAKKAELDPLLELAGVADLLPERTSSDDAERSKPDPDIVLAALRTAGARSEQAVLLGDTPYDVLAAARAGVDTIALRCGGFSDAQLGGAIMLYDDPAELLARYDSSPLGRITPR